MPISREEIIDEIHKFLVANNGEIPGERTFLNATRIKQSAWKDRYWVRWTDAVREAGYDPKSMTQRIPEEDMLAKLAEFVIELGHFPVQGEFRLHARTRESLPHWTTIKNRYGGMPETAAALLEFGRLTSNTVLVNLCLARLERKNIQPILEKNGRPTTSKLQKVGFVYLKYSPSLRLYKIGKANNPKKRGAGISLLLPEDLVPKHEIKTDCPYILEKYWENRFRDKKKQGEWYELNSADVIAFKNVESLCLASIFRRNSASLIAFSSDPFRSFSRPFPNARSFRLGDSTCGPSPPAPARQ